MTELASRKTSTPPMIRPCRVTHRHDVHIHGDPTPILVPQEHALAPGLTRINGLLERAGPVAQFTAGRVTVLQDLGRTVAPDDFFGRIAGQHFGGTIPEENAPRTVHEVHSVVEVVEQFAEEVRPERQSSLPDSYVKSSQSQIASAMTYSRQAVLVLPPPVRTGAAQSII